MAFITIFEIIDIAIMTLALGYVFMRIFDRPQPQDVMDYYTKKKSDWKPFWFAVAVVAPGIILHELGHKFVALLLGQQATFYAACSVTSAFGLPGSPGLLDFPCLLLTAVVVLSYFNIPFLIFVPGYVQHVGNASQLGLAAIAFAGPAVNGLLWLFATLAVRGKWFKKKYTLALVLTARINMFLFFFNLIPIPPFDGFQVALGIIRTIFHF
jgi:Zn-dependent protease